MPLNTLGIQQKVIHVHNNPTVKQIKNYFVHYPLKRARRIAKAKWHYQKLIGTIPICKSSFLDTTLLHGKLMVCIVDVYFTENITTIKLLCQCIYTC